MTLKYLSVPLAELKEVIFREEALVSFLTKDLDTPPCIHMETTSTHFKQITFTYVYNEEKQSWFDVLLKRKRYKLVMVYNTQFGTQTLESPLQTSKGLPSTITSWDEEYKPLNKIYKAQ
ncbi:MAG: hypothetical protein RR575_00295 [Acinetobacter sp.]